MNFEVYSYWNIQELAGVFNAIAALTGGGEYRGLLKTLALVGVLSIAMVTLAGRGKLENMWQWFFMMVIFNGMLLVPKTNVILVDRTGTQPTMAVDNVPLGLASFAHGISKIGDWLTTSYETIFSLPDDLKFQQNGFLFGHRVQKELRNLNFNSQAYNDFTNFYRECLIPEFWTRNISTDDLAKSNDAWAFLNGKLNPALYVTIGGTLYDCVSAYNTLSNNINSYSDSKLSEFAAQFYPNNPQAVARMTNAIVASDDYFLGLSRVPRDAIKQAMVANALIDGECTIQSMSGNDSQAANCIAKIQAIRSTNNSYLLMAKVAEATMPKIRSAIEIVQYAIFPVILLLIIAAGHRGFFVLKGYAQSLLWIQLWAPLYAVVHYIMSVKASLLESQTQGLGASVAYQTWMQGAIVSDEAIAGMLVLSIPAIAWGLVKGAEVGMTAIGDALSTATSAARRSADIETTGNLSLGQVNAAPTVTTGAQIAQFRDMSGGITTKAESGAASYTAMLDNMTTKIDATNSIKTVARQSQEAALSSAFGQAVEFGHVNAGIIDRAARFLQSHGTDKSFVNSVGVENAANHLNAAENAMSLQRQAMERTGASEKLAAQVRMMAQAEMSFPGLLKAISPIDLGAKFGMEGASTSDIEKARSAAMQLANDQSYRQSVQTLLKAASDDKFSSAEASTSSGAYSLNALSAEAKRHQEKIGAELKKAETYRDIAERASENSVQISQAITSRVNDRLASMTATIDGHTYNGLTREDIEAIDRYGSAAARRDLNEIRQKLVEEETKNYLNAMVNERVDQGKEIVQGHFDDAQKMVPGAVAARAFGDAGIGNTLHQAAQSGNNPFAVVHDRGLTAYVNKQQDQATTAVDAQKQMIEGQGSDLQQKVDDATKSFSMTTLAGQAATNLGASAGLGNVNFLLSKVGDTDVGKALMGTTGFRQGSFAGEAASKYAQSGGTIYTAIGETALMVTPLGGTLGKGVAKVLGKGAATATEEVTEKAAKNLTLYAPDDVSFMLAKALQNNRENSNGGGLAGSTIASTGDAAASPATSSNSQAVEQSKNMPPANAGTAGGGSSTPSNGATGKNGGGDLPPPSRN